jgi:endonuclease-3 related protein
MARNWPRTLEWIFDRLLEHFGERNWWPGDTKFEVVIGAILTQNTAWRNVEKAIGNLKREGLLDEKGLHRASTSTVAKLVRPSGYYNQKARRLKIFTHHLHNRHGGDLEAMFESDVSELREELLGIEGIGPETADSIILYAAGKPTFVVDAYTLRLVRRFPFPVKPVYGTVKQFFEENLKRDVYLFNEYHALVVWLGKDLCGARKTRCRDCPLNNRCKKLIR